MDIICGTYDRTLYRNEKNGYTLFSFITKDYDEYKTKTGTLICTGKIPMYTIGFPLKVVGNFIKKNDQYIFATDSVTEYSNIENITMKYLTSDIFEGVGEKLAEKIIKSIGCDVFSFSEQSDAADCLSLLIPEINREKAVKIISIIRNTTIQKKIYEYIYAFGGEFIHASELYRLYNINALTEIKKNCYEAGILAGMPFETCDSIAKAQGKDAYNKERIESLFKYSITQLSNCGNIYSSIDDITDMANKLVLNSAFKDDKIPQCLLVRAAYTSKYIIIENSNDDYRFYLKPLWISENNIVKNLKRIQNNTLSFPYDESIIDDIEQQFHIKYAQKQKDAFDFLKNSGVKILTGGPGTGKTTVINGLICAYKYMYPNNSIVLCAPTGRAAQRVSESTNMPATTIHKLLDLKPYDNIFTCRDQNTPLTADFIIVDEMSMTDENIFSMLVGAIKDNALVLLCGDVDQLPSVGAGNVLNDLIKSENFEVNKLDVVYRQSGDSDIIYNANLVNNGNDNLRTSRYFKIIEVDTDAEIKDNVLDIVSSNYSKANPFNLQILSSTKKGSCGTFALNKNIQQMCNNNPPMISYGSTAYKIGDKVLMLRNNYDVGYINGDTGIITEINTGGVVVDINGEEITIERKLLGDMTLAYSMTIHKSQGSEYKTVVIALPEFPRIMLKRNLLYTAITRAKQNVIIVTKKDVIKKASQTLDNSMRKTSLDEKLKGFVPELL